MVETKESCAVFLRTFHTQIVTQEINVSALVELLILDRNWCVKKCMRSSNDTRTHWFAMRGLFVEKINETNLCVSYTAR